MRRELAWDYCSSAKTEFVNNTWGSACNETFSFFVTTLICQQRVVNTEVNCLFYREIQNKKLGDWKKYCHIKFVQQIHTSRSARLSLSVNLMQSSLLSIHPFSASCRRRRRVSISLFKRVLSYEKINSVLQCYLTMTGKNMSRRGERMVMAIITMMVIMIMTTKLITMSIMMTRY